MESLMAIHGHREDPDDTTTMNREIERWSLKRMARTNVCMPFAPYTDSTRQADAKMLLSHLGFSQSYQDPKFGRLLAIQIVRWSWEVQYVQRCASRCLPFHPVRAAWLWLEEYGPDLWPENAEARGHLHQKERDPKTGYVYLRDRREVHFVPQPEQTPKPSLENMMESFCEKLTQSEEQTADIDENIAAFCVDKRFLDPRNTNFCQVLQLFAGVYSGLWDNVDYTTCEDRTAAQLMAEFLGQEPWQPQMVLLPLFYELASPEVADWSEASNGSSSTGNTSGSGDSIEGAEYVSAREVLPDSPMCSIGTQELTGELAGCELGDGAVLSS